ncbi:Gfo/Idh/MocA family protein [Dictyobacter arantiisoli]|uniref:Oxidoreductase n=1 Tax=Dictyobacter arantiisoli TaxID=2014874 RepID=A0A5A5TGR5_9CHLR|nr:Gfo/Idh/MocA family oxidoreductase [Dictyobacter arantiisoli]GCF10253.1 oxidoreductase [Dictyobacter arantiisoli]
MGPTSMNQLRYAIIGAGAGVFGMHRQALQSPDIQIVAVADVVPSAAEQRGQELDCAWYTDHQQLLSKVRPDVVVVMTPHPYHARIAIDSLQSGSHVLVEKPMAVQVKDADAMIEASEQAERIVGVVFQQRFRPEIIAARQLIQSGQLGRIQHVTMSAVWTRTARYYQSAGWRGTWKGEGGGVLMNQACHHLDLLCHLMGMPTRVFGWTRRLQHTIETEDTVEGALEWVDGALGSIHISTAEADQSEYLKLVGTRGQLELQGGQLNYRALETDLTQFIATHPKAMASPAMQDVPVEIDNQSRGSHSTVYQALNTAIRGGTPFSSAGAEGRMSLELANALIYSSYTHSYVDLPLNREHYSTLLTKLIDKQITL